MAEHNAAVSPAVSPPMIEATFRNGTLTAVSVMLGFSLSFLVRWSALPGAWRPLDLVAVAVIATGIILEIVAVADMLFVGSLVRARYNRAVTIFLVGLALVVIGSGLAIVGDVLGLEQNVTRG